MDEHLEIITKIKLKILQMIIKFYIMNNAEKLGWDVEIEDNTITLSKKSDLLTTLDRNTNDLLNVLIYDNS
jgi:hypothetical protein